MTAVDRTDEFLSLVKMLYKNHQLPADVLTTLTSDVILKPVKARTPFMSTASNVASGIRDLHTFVKAHRRQFMAAAGYSKADKDRVEQEVGQYVAQCTQQINHMKDSILAAQQAGPGRRINEQTTAHLHGVVLILAEQLHAVSTTFDKCRALRYQQSLLAQSKDHLQAAPLAPSNGAGQTSRQTVQHDNQRGEELSNQQMMITDTETALLMEELSTLTDQARTVEQSLHDVAVLNQMFSTAVLAQAEQIEMLYDNAVLTTLNIGKGNEMLTKTIAVNRSSRCYIAAFFLIATVILLFFDWFNK